MNRRQFLQSLAALGYGIALPAGALADAPEAAIEQAWEAAVGNPYTFYVDSRGIISFSNDELWARPRAELLGLFPVTSRTACSNWPTRSGHSSRSSPRSTPAIARSTPRSPRTGAAG